MLVYLGCCFQAEDGIRDLVRSRGLGDVYKRQPAYLLLGLVGVALARIDADVHRLPQGLTHPTAVLVPGLLAVSTVATGRWAALGGALVIGLLVGVVFLLLAGAPWGAATPRRSLCLIF